jgi:hypothetical protein
MYTCKSGQFVVIAGIFIQSAVWEFRAAPTPWLVMTPKRSV